MAPGGSPRCRALRHVTELPGSTTVAELAIPLAHDLNTRICVEGVAVAKSYRLHYFSLLS